MPVHVWEGDIWTMRADVRVNTVNCVGVMGKGIAKEFKSRYPAMFEDYSAYCRARQLEPGGIHVYADESVTILNVATKDHWYNPSKYEWIVKGCTNIGEWLAGAKEPLTVAMPALGCSNGGLNFEEVHLIVADILGHNEHVFCLFRPEGR